MTPPLLHVAARLAVVAADDNGKGIGDIKPEAPGFAGQFTQLVSWVLWGCTLLCVVGIAVIGTMLAVSIRRGETGEHAARLGAAAAGVVIVGLATQIVNALL